MIGLLAALLFVQDPFQDQIDEALRQFEAAAEVDQALTILSAQLSALGARASNPIARRLAEDLRDGMASAAVPALIDSLVGRPEALAPLQTAFRDAATTAAGRIELAEALLHLDDALSWRAGILGIASDGEAALGDRLRACKVLLEADDAQVPEILGAIVDGLPDRSPEEQRQIAAFLTAANTPLTRELLGRIAASRRSGDEPSVRIIDDPERPVLEPVARTPQKKKETREATFLTMPSIVAGGVTLLLLVLLAVEILRKG